MTNDRIRRVVYRILNDLALTNPWVVVAFAAPSLLLMAVLTWPYAERGAQAVWSVIHGLMP